MSGLRRTHCALDGKRRDPYALRQLWRRWVKMIIWMGERIPAPGALNQMQMIRKCRAALFKGQTKRQKRGRRAAGTKTDFETPVGQQIQHRRIFCHTQRVLHWQGDNCGTQSNFFRLRRNVGEEYQR
ncbi:hypothetical protein D3C76_1267360 [compost metagenome]